VKYSSNEVQAAGDTVQKQAALAGSTQGGTLLTGGQGLLAPADTGKKSLLGA
jgi:hypothetical protein